MLLRAKSHFAFSINPSDRFAVLITVWNSIVIVSHWLRVTKVMRCKKHLSTALVSTGYFLDHQAADTALMSKEGTKSKTF